MDAAAGGAAADGPPAPDRRASSAFDGAADGRVVLALALADGVLLLVDGRAAGALPFFGGCAGAERGTGRARNQGVAKERAGDHAEIGTAALRLGLGPGARAGAAAGRRTRWPAQTMDTSDGRSASSEAARATPSRQRAPERGTRSCRGSKGASGVLVGRQGPGEGATHHCRTRGRDDRSAQNASSPLRSREARATRPVRLRRTHLSITIHCAVDLESACGPS